MAAERVSRYLSPDQPRHGDHCVIESGLVKGRLIIIVGRDWRGRGAVLVFRHRQSLVLKWPQHDLGDRPKLPSRPLKSLEKMAIGLRVALARSMRLAAALAGPTPLEIIFRRPPDQGCFPAMARQACVRLEGVSLCALWTVLLPRQLAALGLRQMLQTRLHDPYVP